MSKDPYDYDPGAYDYKAWWSRPKGNTAYRFETHYHTWRIFQGNEFWDRRLLSLSNSD